jgi:hypothetical protein
MLSILMNIFPLDSKVEFEPGIYEYCIRGILDGSESTLKTTSKQAALAAYWSSVVIDKLGSLALRSLFNNDAARVSADGLTTCFWWEISKPPDLTSNPAIVLALHIRFNINICCLPPRLEVSLIFVIIREV